MLLPRINGRECVPVRLLPILTGSMPLAPDVVASLFAMRHPFTKWHLAAFQLDNKGKLNPVNPRSWDRIDDDLKALVVEVGHNQTSEPLANQEWERRSLRLLPAAVFVWKDELEAEFARVYGRMSFPIERPGLPELGEEEQARDLVEFCRIDEETVLTEERAAAVDARMASTLQSLLSYRPGDGKLDFDPLLNDELHRVTFEGFDSLLTVTSAHALSAEQRADVKRRVERGESQSSLAREYGVSRTTISNYVSDEMAGNAAGLTSVWPPTKTKRNEPK
jgi:uncharacterized protein YerC